VSWKEHAPVTQPTRAPAAPSRGEFLGIARWVWLAAWLPLLPTAAMSLLAPHFEAPLFETPPAIACLVLLPFLNLGAGRLANGSDASPAVAVALTTAAGSLLSFFGPALISLSRVA
jgi:hypothetical protein